MENLMKLVSNNKRPLSMESGIASLKDATVKTSKNGNPYISITFQEVGTEDDERLGCDDALTTTNINKFEQSFRRLYYLFVYSNNQELFAKHMPNSYYTKLPDLSMTIDKDILFQKALELKKNRDALLEETLREQANKHSEAGGYPVDYSYKYDDGNYEVSFYKIDLEAKKLAISSINTALNEIIGSEFYIHTELKPVRGKEFLTDCVVKKYASAR
jgi:hypothetical protein